MDLRDLRYFVTAAELGHIHRAADVLHITQPALTKSVRRLEAAIGARLFEPVGRRVRLTEAGAALAQHARLLLRTAEETARQVHDLATGAAGRVRLGASATAVELLLPAVTPQLIADMPGVMLDIDVGMNDRLCARLKDGELDLVLCPVTGADPALDARTFAKDPVVVVASADHPLFGQRSIALSDLARHRWVLPSASGASTAWLAHVFQSRGLPEPVAQIRSASISLTPRLLVGTRLLSFIARRNLAVRNVGATLREVPLRATTMSRDFAAVWRKGAYLSPATLRVRELVLRRGAAILDGNASRRRSA